MEQLHKSLEISAAGEIKAKKKVQEGEELGNRAQQQPGAAGASKRKLLLCSVQRGPSKTTTLGRPGALAGSTTVITGTAALKA